MILNRQKLVGVSTSALELFLGRVRRELRLGEAQVTVCLVSDAEIAGMNEQFRHKAGPTDVLSFPAAPRRAAVSAEVAEADEPRSVGRGRLRRRLRVPLELVGGETLGDIAIAPAVAQRNAKIDGRTLPAELKILVLHGVLHLLGYDHETDRGEMQRTEVRLRKRLGLA
jgi:probable rRNA maturation factor